MRGIVKYNNRSFIHKWWMMKIIMKTLFRQPIPVTTTFHLLEDIKQTQSTFPPVAYGFSCRVVQLSSVATWFSVNLYKCGLDPQGRDSLASTPTMDQQAFLCTPSGSVSTGKRQVLHLTWAVRTNSERSHKIHISLRMQKCQGILNCLTPGILHNLIPQTLKARWPSLAQCQVRCLQRKA